VETAALQLEIALEAGRMGVFDWNIRDQKIWWSPAVERIHGIPVGSFDGTFEMYMADMHLEDRDRVIELVGKMLAKPPRDYHIEYRIVRPDGSVRWLEAFGRFSIEDGVATRLVGVCCDVTERRDRERELEHARAEAERASRAREDLVAMVSHDLRNPLGSISTTAAMIRKVVDTPNGTPERLLKYVDLIERAAARMNRWIGDLLDLSRIDAGGLSLETRSYPSGQLLRETVDLFAPQAAQKAIHLVPGGSDAVVRCDRERILQVLSNLVGNALKFTPDGGRVEIASEPVLSGVQFSVRDNGPGVEADERGRIFDRYWQAQRGRGVGLGLSIAKALVELHGGRIWCESEPGAGASFFFTVPSA
jgi:PAS domain S-box-containing protein